MPSWTEKPVTIPAVNVNTKPCTCGGRETKHSITGARSIMHLDSCSGAPVLIPCPLPRSVPFTVRLGECNCAQDPDDTRLASPAEHHLSSCPARPIRVSCSISGKTWEESEVLEAACDGTQWQPSWSPANEALLVACRERWGFIKSLVLGHSLTDCPEAIQNMRGQRDAVYARIAAMALAERAVGPAHVAMFKALDAADVAYAALGPSSCPDAPYAERGLAAYVEHLVEQVGVLQ